MDTIVTVLTAIADWLECHAGAVTAIATLFIAGFTGTIWRVNRNQLKHARKTDRAYLDAGPGGGDGLPRADGKTRIVKEGKVRIRLHVTNHGKTPAKLTRMWWDVVPRSKLPIGKPRYAKDAWLPGGMKITPDGKHFQTRYYREYRLDWSEQHVAYGRIEYTDVFDDPHHWSFLLSIVRHGDEFTHPPMHEVGYEQYWTES